MAKQVSVRIDDKGRISLPVEVRLALGASTGDTVFLKYEPKGHLVRMVRAVEDPVAVLWEQAEEEFKSGGTRNLRDYASEHGVPIEE